MDIELTPKRRTYITVNWARTKLDVDAYVAAKMDGMETMEIDRKVMV